MTDLVLVVVLLAAGAGAHWLLADLRTLPHGGAHRHAAPSVSVVIPARNEETSLPGLLESLRQLTVEVHQTVVVDDGSRDATASVARSAGADVLPAGVPETGWTGKAWACHVGARATSGDLLLFLDADTVLAPDALAGAFPGSPDALTVLAGREVPGGWAWSSWHVYPAAGEVVRTRSSLVAQARAQVQP